MVSVAGASTHIDEGELEDVLADFGEESGKGNEELEFEEDNIDVLSSKPSHVCFIKSTIMKGHIEVLKNTNYISEIDMVRHGGEDTTPLLEKKRWCYSKAS